MPQDDEGADQARKVLRPSDLKKSEAPWPATLETLRSGERKSPREHQQVAIDKTIADSRHTSAVSSMACGSGKTLTSLWLAEAMKSERTLVLLLHYRPLPDPDRVGSELRGALGVSPGLLDARWRPRPDDGMVSELGVPATTNATMIQKFLAEPGRRWSSTYQSSPRIAEALAGVELPPFDLAIADEAHRCAGKVSADFGTILDAAAILHPAAVHDCDSTGLHRSSEESRQETENEIASMDDETIFGPVFHQLNFWMPSEEPQ